MRKSIIILVMSLFIIAICITSIVINSRSVSDVDGESLVREWVRYFVDGEYAKCDGIFSDMEYRLSEFSTPNDDSGLSKEVYYVVLNCLSSNTELMGVVKTDHNRMIGGEEYTVSVDVPVLGLKEDTFIDEGSIKSLSNDFINGKMSESDYTNKLKKVAIDGLKTSITGTDKKNRVTATLTVRLSENKVSLQGVGGFLNTILSESNMKSICTLAEKSISSSMQRMVNLYS